MNARIETVVLDMAGTTVVDDGLVEEAFARAWDRERGEAMGLDGVDREGALQWVRDTMGQSKIEVFRRLLPEDDAQALNRAFEAAYDELVGEGRSIAIEGAEAAIRALRAQGRKVVLTTGFARPTADAIVASLGWIGLPDLVLTPADAGRGRPLPDLNLMALIRTQASSVHAIAVVGDTATDIGSGLAAGAGLVVGVLTGATPREAFETAGAHQVLGSVAELPELLERLGR
ncbi:MAG: HAD family hydrolase [Microbacteriaceae bacterium]|nr:HAD family hydrolase [Microbacteriaceae bacterium]